MSHRWPKEYVTKRYQPIGLVLPFTLCQRRILSAGYGASTSPPKFSALDPGVVTCQHSEHCAGFLQGNGCREILLGYPFFQVASVGEKMYFSAEVVYHDGHVTALLVILPTAQTNKRVQYHHALTKVQIMGRPRTHAYTTVLDCVVLVRHIFE